MGASVLGPVLSQLKDLSPQHSSSSPVKDSTGSCLAAPEDHDSQPHTLLISWFLLVPLQV